MLVNKIVLAPDLSLVTQQIQIEEMDQNLLLIATKALDTLQAGASSITIPIPEGEELTVALGIQPNEYVEQFVYQKWQERCPDAERSEYDAMKHDVREKQRRTGFHATYRGVTIHFELITMDCPEGDPGVYGSVAGMSLHSHPVSEQESEQEREATHQKLLTVVNQMVALKPAFLARSLEPHPASTFADYFACAMLLGQQREPMP